jgi:two-component system OmpR family sensor kinase
MMFHSLKNKISLIFLLSLLFVTTFFLFYLQSIKTSRDQEVSKRYKGFSSYIRTQQITHQNIAPYLASFGFVHEAQKEQILQTTKQIADGRGYQAYREGNQYYYYVQRKGYHHLFRDTNDYPINPLVYLGFVLILLLLLLIYLWLLRSLKPLSTLQHHINAFAKGDLSISCASDKKDEIAIVSNAFDRAVKEIRLLLQSRQLFLRTIMHELKTPIAKGRIVTSLLDDTTQEARLITIFEKLDSLINYFAKVEEILSKNYQLQKHPYSVETILQRTLEMLLLDPNDQRITINYLAYPTIQSDRELLAIVLKNLLDNALKYATDKKATITVSQNSIEILSKGTPLKHPLENYFKPFHNEINMRHQGMGLGLYIVKSIVDMHQMHFYYTHQKGENLFGIGF